MFTVGEEYLHLWVCLLSLSARLAAKATQPISHFIQKDKGCVCGEAENRKEWGNLNYNADGLIWLVICGSGPELACGLQFRDLWHKMWAAIMASSIKIYSKQRVLFISTYSHLHFLFSVFLS